MRSVLERKKLYDLVIELRAHGKSYREIIAEAKARYGLRLPKSDVSDWARLKHKPFGSVRGFDSSPTPELAYVIGVMRGDGNLSKQRWSHRIRLRVTDIEFAREFNRCTSVVLGCNPHSLQFIESRRQWSLDISSILLYRFLKQPLTKLKVTIEHCAECISAFLRGFFDSEGSSSQGVITCSNNDLALLKYIRHCLKFSFGIECTGPHKQGQPPGTSKLIKGVLYNVNEQNYLLRIRKASNGTFQSRIGFSIRRKREIVVID